MSSILNKWWSAHVANKFQLFFQDLEIGSDFDDDIGVSLFVIFIFHFYTYIYWAWSIRNCTSFLYFLMLITAVLLTFKHFEAI